MEYQNIDEVARREACERVKQIVKAIKAMKIKYYLNFSKISAKDQETYQQLETNLEKISNSHNLNNLKVALMAEIEAKYEKKDFGNSEQGNRTDPDEILQACYGAIDAEIDALSRGRITQAIRCQEQLNKYKQKLDDINKKEVKSYKREKLAELVITREQIEEQIKLWNSDMKGMFKIKHTEHREAMAEMFKLLDNKENENIRNGEEINN